MDLTQEYLQLNRTLGVYQARLKYLTDSLSKLKNKIDADTSGVISKEIVSGEIGNLLNMALNKMNDAVNEGVNEDTNEETSAQKKKFDKVMHEFGQGKLKSSNGDKVTDQKQALAIAYSESGLDESVRQIVKNIIKEIKTQK